MSAIADSADGPNEIVKVLVALFPGYDTLDVAGPLEILREARHNPKDLCKLLTAGEYLNLELFECKSR